jgi:hypothetical protein
MAIQVGNSVRLNIPDVSLVSLPLMVVLEVDGSNITCLWYNTSQELQQFTFPAALLTFVETVQTPM